MVLLQTPRKNASLFAPVVPEIESPIAYQQHIRLKVLL